MASTVASKTCSFVPRWKHLLRQPATKSKSWTHHARRSCANSSCADPYKSTDKIDVEALFISPKVQNFLQKLTGFDVDKIFAPVPVPLNTPRYKFLTDEQLEQELQESHRRARQKLQMPPVLRERKPCEEVLSKDPEIQGFTSSSYIFTDISYGYKNRERLIVVREPEGVLRTANWEERERMLQTYFSNKDKSFYMPKMFEPGYLQDVLDKQWYRFVLDRACIQFEPDDAEYIRVTHATYDHIDAKRGFHELRSTRHFGPMAFYLAVVGKVDNLLIDLLQREMIDDTGHLLRLFYHIHPPADGTQVDENSENIELLKFYIRNNSQKRSHMELALQTYLEIRRSQEEAEKNLASARGHS
uniref:Putative 28s ribosomal protein ovary overexpressed n=1 Tax=Rhipicephalus microplus TaxID=6941 RepID=A0A6M2CT39_RHIMP